MSFFPKTSLSIKVKECHCLEESFAIKYLYTITHHLDPWLPVTIEVWPALSARQPHAAVSTKSHLLAFTLHYSTCLCALKFQFCFCIIM